MEARDGRREKGVKEREKGEKRGRREKIREREKGEKWVRDKEEK